MFLQFSLHQKYQAVRLDLHRRLLVDHQLKLEEGKKQQGRNNVSVQSQCLCSVHSVNCEKLRILTDWHLTKEVLSRCCYAKQLYNSLLDVNWESVKSPAKAPS